MLLRNIDQANGLCNGTKLQVNELGKNVIGATIITGKNIGHKILIPRMDLIPRMTINKSQGQTLFKVGFYLRRPVFTHGHLYVVVSRVKSKKGLKILILDEDGQRCTSTINVVYNEVFQNLENTMSHNT